MPRASKTAITTKTSGTSLAMIDDALAAEVGALKSQIGQASGNKIKVEATGDFILPDGMNLGNEIQVVVIDFITRHNYYIQPYVPGVVSPPDCYALGKELATLVPEPDSPEVQAEKCIVCPLNAFGSGKNGVSKACKNSRLLAVLLVDPEDPDAVNARDAPIYTLELPPTAIKSFDGAAAYTARSLMGPPVKAIFTVSAKNAGTYALITFTDPLPNPGYASHFARRGETFDMLTRKPDFTAIAAKTPPRGRAPARRTTAARR